MKHKRLSERRQVLLVLMDMTAGGIEVGLSEVPSKIHSKNSC